MAEYPYLINLWTTFIFFFEPAFAILVWNRTARPLIVGLCIPFWLGIAVLTGMIPFALTMIVASLAFIDADGLRRVCGCAKAA
jgi:hypothetical protein